MAVGLKTLLEAAQYLEEQEQQQRSPISSIVNSNHHLNGGGNDTNASCFIAHYSLAVAGNRSGVVNGSPVTSTSNSNSNSSSTPMQTGVTTILNDENHKTANMEGFFANGHAGVETAVADNFATRKSTCQNIIKSTGNKKQLQQQQQQNNIIATSAPASSTGFQQQVAFGNGFSLTTKTKSPTELFISGNLNGSDRKDVNETNNNNNNNHANKGQLVTGAIIQQQQQQQQHMNNHHSTLPTNSSNILNNNSTSSSSNSSNSNNNHHKLLTNNNNNNNNKSSIINNEDFDTNSLSPPGPQRVRSASTSSNVYVFGSLDHAKSAANHANRLQSNVLHANADGKGLQMMLVNEANGANNIASWMINNHSPQKNNSMEGISSPMDVISPKSFTNIGGSQSHMSISSLGSNGRRRTMSSTSNGAGTREVHNKLEKNRRAHLKECYEKLKSQLNLKDEDRKKTSNLAVLGEALNQVMALQKKDQELEAKIEQLAKDKINSQKRIVTLKRELGPRYEQIFSGIFPDSEITMTSIPNERDNFNNMACLSSGRGSVLYSSSNSLSSSGGSSCNNTLLSSPGGVNHLQTNATTIIPVIPKNNMAGIKLNGIGNVNVNGNTSTTTTSLSTVSKNGDIFLQQQQQQQLNKAGTTNHASNITSSPDSPSSTTVMGVNNLVISTATVNAAGNNLPLSLTAKNISDTSLTRGSPTPSTPSPSPSSSSGVSSSSSFISSSPPIVNNNNNNNNTTPTVTIINGNGNNNNNNNNGNCTTTTTTTTARQVCINIPNGLKFHVANNGGLGTGVVSFQGTIANGATGTTTTATVGTKNGNYQP